MYLTCDEIKKRLDSSDPSKRLVIRPLLSDNQWGEMTLDLRLGTDFLVCNFGREPVIDVTGDARSRHFMSLFTETRRVIGQPFTFYPHQLVLCSTIEYIKLPEDVFMTLSARSSYSRLGFTMSTIIQPGYCGCLPIELINGNDIPVKVRTGSRILQARFFQLQNGSNYFSKNRKYYCQVRPELSKALEDGDISILQHIAEDL